MNYAHFAHREPPWIHLLPGSEEEACVWSYRLHLLAADERMTVRMVRGRKMRTDDSLFDEVAAAWQFPYYFGENWWAFSDCIEDMTWMPQTAHTFVVMRTDLVLPESDGSFRTFIGRLTDATNWWNVTATVPRVWPNLPFHVVLHTLPELMPQLKERLLRVIPDLVMNELERFRIEHAD